MAAPTEIYVDPSIAADSGTGTIGDPFGDVQFALDSVTRDATNGDRFNIKAGTDEVLASSLSLATYGTPTGAAPLIIQGYTTAAGDGGIGGISGGGSVSVFDDSALDFIVFIDMHLHNCGSATVVRLDNDITFIHCEIDNTSGAGIFCDVRLIVIDCHIHNCGAQGVRFQQDAGYIYGCTLENGTNDFTAAIDINGSGSQALFNIINIDGSSHGIVISNGRNNIRTINNSVWSNGGTGNGIDLGGTSDLIHCHNNIVEGFSGTGGVGLNVGSATRLYTFGKNSFYNNATNVSNSGDTIHSVGNNTTLGASPFTDAANDDFTVGDSVKALAFPTANYPGLSVRSFLDIGALQREEAGGGGDPIARPGLHAIEQGVAA